MAMRAIETSGLAYDANGVALTPLFGKAGIAAATTDGAVIAAVASKKIRVLAFALAPATTATACTFTSKPAGAGTAISAIIEAGSTSTTVFPYNPLGWFETVAGEGLSLTTGAGSTVGVQVTYVTV